MTEKELHRLRRQDLLQLLLSQSREVAEQGDRIQELEGHEQELEALTEKLKGRLNEKDELIEKLKARLDEKDALIRDLREGRIFEAGDPVTGTVSAPIRIEELFGVTRRAAELYLREKARVYAQDKPPEKDEP